MPRHKTLLIFALLPTLAACGLNVQTHHVSSPRPVPARTASPATPGPNSNFSITPANPAQGDTVDLRFSFTHPPESISLLVNGQAQPFYPTGNGYRALLGTDPSSSTGTHQVKLTATYQGGFATTSTSGFTLQPGSFATRTITLPTNKTPLLSPAVGAQEVNLSESALSTRTLDQLWQGPFTLPLGNAPIDSPYGYWGVYNGTPEWFHEGVDFTAAAGAPVHASATGVVVLSKALPRGGNTVIINHGQGVLSEYLHLETMAVQAGQTVTQGQIVGTVGSTGLTTGPGLHWAVFVNGIPVNPLLWATAPPG